MRQNDILKYWRDVEIFDLPSFNEDSIPLQNGDLPWLKAKREPKKNYQWRYTLFFGKIDNSLIIDQLNTLLKTESTDWEEPTKGFSCLSALIINQQGYIEQDSYVLASYVLGIDALKRNKELSTISLELTKVKQDFLERYNISESQVEQTHLSSRDKVVHWDHLKTEIVYLSNLAPWYDDEIKVFVLTEEVYKDSEPVVGFLNSFYLDDLNYLINLKTSDFSSCLKQYLTLEPKVESRSDLIENKEFLFDSINPALLPMGRWPSKTEYGLYTAQSGAVNTIFSNLEHEEGIQGVNGPPGTGKTTLLLDVIAEVIVKRAQVISELGSTKIFEPGYTKIKKETDYDLYTYRLNSKLQQNFGIVVASNNNAAVENISKELPAIAKIDTCAFEHASYFSQCATDLIQEQSWGVLAAPLGNSRNRVRFREAFWKSNKEEDSFGFEALLYSIYKNDDKSEIYLHEFEKENKKFKHLIQLFKDFQRDSSYFHELLPKYLNNVKLKEKYLSQLKKLEYTLSCLVQEKDNLLDKKVRAEKNANTIKTSVELLMASKPSFFFFQKLLKTKNYRLWKIQAEEIFSQLKEINNQLRDLDNLFNICQDKIKDINFKQNDIKIHLVKLKEFFNDYDELKKTLNHEYEIDTKNIFDKVFYKKSITDLHLLNPYHSKKIAQLRSEIFLSALKLHENAILANAKNIRNNLNAYFQMTQGVIKVDDRMTQNLWDTFFLCVPVISTTLASASRLFSSLNKQQIGWLLLDEAGQATPQSAVGLMHRSKRCVIVGDPLQVEPVVTMPIALLKRLRQEYHVPVDWSCAKVSVQQLADRVSKLGTYMRIGDSDINIWTGFPLRTHRRCDDPMFAIANKIAYSGQMVKAINENSKEELLGESRWFNINKEVRLENKHVIVQEIDFLQDKISQLRKSGFKEDIYVISPFKSIATYCDTIFKYDNRVYCGTIHKFQGKEADVVFLVLGSDPKSTGARNWASEKPNMLNVAVTRAKKRFYVIGNKKLWAACDYFNVMASVLK